MTLNHIKNVSKFFTTTLIGLFLLFINTANAKVRTAPLCKSISDTKCFVKNSEGIYRSNPNKWWEYYKYNASAAKGCKSKASMSSFLTVWSAYTDGEMAESLSADTENILLNTDQKCFLEGMLLLNTNQQNALLSKFCPVDGDNEKILAKLKMNAKNQRYVQISKALIDRINSKTCQEFQ